MKNPATGRQIQRSEFIDSLYANLRRKTEKAIANNGKLILLAASYIQDGLEPAECAELLMIEGNLSRKSAEDYISLAKTSVPHNESNEYIFHFEDNTGNRMSSHEIGRIITASTEKEAMDKAEEIINELNIEASVIGVSKA